MVNKFSYSKKSKFKIHHDDGFSAIAALFILVVIGVLASFIVTISVNQHLSISSDVEQTRAYEAARSGIEWGLFKQLRQSSCSNQVNMNHLSDQMSQFTVSVRCQKIIDPHHGPTGYRIESTACNQPTAGQCPNTDNPDRFYIERRIEVKLNTHPS